jgi:hypothetical protein
MRVWLKSIAASLGFDDAAERSVREILSAAALRSAEAGLGSSEHNVCPDSDFGFVDSVDDEGVSLAFAPQRRGVEFIVGERLWIAIATSRGFHRGETQILSRWNESASGGGRRRLGLRVSIPASLTHVQRRFTLRVPVAFDLAPTAIIVRAEGDQTPIKVPILDLSESGVLVRAPASAQLTLNTQVKLAANFPSAIPSFETVASVSRIGPSKVEGCVSIGMHFEEPLSELAKSIRALDVRRSNRPAA